MKTYHVKVAVQTLEIYEIEAEDEAAAAEALLASSVTAGLTLVG